MTVAALSTAAMTFGSAQGAEPGIDYGPEIATNALIAGGQYLAALKRWGLESEALARSETNPPGLPKFG